MAGIDFFEMLIEKEMEEKKEEHDERTSSSNANIQKLIERKFEKEKQNLPIMRRFEFFFNLNATI